MDTAIIVALIAMFGGAVIGPVISALLRRAERHNKHDEDEADDMSKWRKEVDKQLEADRKRVDAVEEGIDVLCKGMLQICNHMLDGDHTDQLVDARNGLQDYLIKR